MIKPKSKGCQSLELNSQSVHFFLLLSHSLSFSLSFSLFFSHIISYSLSFLFFLIPSLSPILSYSISLSLLFFLFSLFSLFSLSFSLSLKFQPLSRAVDVRDRIITSKRRSSERRSKNLKKVKLKPHRKLASSLLLQDSFSLI